MLKLLNKLSLVNSAASEKVNRSPKKVTMLGRLPQYFPSERITNGLIFNDNSLCKYSKSANKFLDHQEKRIAHAIREKNYEKAYFLGALLLKRSKSYQLCLMNRVIPGGYYHGTESEVHKFGMDLRRKAMKWDLSLTLQRFYLDKGMEKTGIPNGKLRPIGAPTLMSRIFSKALNDMVYYICEDGFKDFQHGYRVNRGTYTALSKAGEYIFVDKHRNVFEFDFKAFFNTISPSVVYECIATKSKLLADLVFSVIKDIRYVYDEIKPEAELKAKVAWDGIIQSILQEAFIPVRRKHYKGGVEGSGEGYKAMPRVFPKDIIVREGLPQGLSISPLLATLALESTKTPRNLLMYADDGLIFGNSDEEIQCGFDELDEIGISIEPSKTKKIEISNEFRFLGTYGNIEKREIRYTSKDGENESILNGSEQDELDKNTKKRVNDWFKRVSSIYGKKPGEGTWDMNRESGAMRYQVKLTGGDYIFTTLAGISNGGMYKGNRYFIGYGIFNISSLSSQCCAGFLEQFKNLTKFIPKKLDEKQQLAVVKKLKELDDSGFEEYINKLENRILEKEKSLKARIRTNRMGRALVRSNAYKVVVNPEYKLEGREGIFTNHTKYIELMKPYECIRGTEKWGGFSRPPIRTVGGLAPAHLIGQIGKITYGSRYILSSNAPVHTFKRKVNLEDR